MRSQMFPYWHCGQDCIMALSLKSKQELTFLFVRLLCSLGIWYYGTTTEPHTVWESYEHHKALIDSPSAPDGMEALKSALGDGPLEMCHTQFRDDPSSVFEAPLTELNFVTPTAGKTAAEVADIFGQILSGLSSQAPNTQGMSKEKDDTLVVVTGWDSVEVRFFLKKIMISASSNPLFVGPSGGYRGHSWRLETSHRKIHRSSISQTWILRADESCKCFAVDLPLGWCDWAGTEYTPIVLTSGWRTNREMRHIDRKK